MAIEIQVPKLGLTMEEATLVAWKFAAGEMVRNEQIVLVLETDKVTYEMPSPGEGFLHPIVAAGSKILVSQVIGYLAADKAELERLSAEHPAAETGSPEKAAGRPVAADVGAPGATPAPAGRVTASPLARSMASAHGLDLGRLRGSGPGGRIVKADILKAMETGLPAKAEPPVPPSAAVAGGLLSVAQELPISGVRRAIFRNMHLSLSTQAQLTLHTEASAEHLIRLRNALSAGGGAKVSYNAILVKVIAHALKEHPLVNASVEGETIKVWRQVHVGVAMDMGRGLIVPKVRNADAKSIRQISADIDRLVEAAKSNSLSLDDLTLGTFTLTNLGAWDIDEFTPIVNHPESAVLGVGRIAEKPVARDGQIIAERRMALSLSFDHRIIDGSPGAAFLKTVKDAMENPLLMLS
jgi:pyruvate/2-oxoglutarate dehydrogenase complex dihydrolipoamide acyltransferase (E2) component